MKHDKAMSDARATGIRVWDKCPSCGGTGQVDPEAWMDINSGKLIPCPTCAAFHAAIDAAIASNNPLCAYGRCKLIDEAVVVERERCAVIVHDWTAKKEYNMTNDQEIGGNMAAIIILEAIRATAKEKGE